MYMDHIKRFAKNWNEMETLVETIRKYSQNTGIEFCQSNNENWKKKKNGRNKSA